MEVKTVYEIPLGHFSEFNSTPQKLYITKGGLEDIITDIVNTAVYYADRGVGGLLELPLYYWGIDGKLGKKSIREVMKNYDIAPFSDYVNVYNKVIKDLNLPFKTKYSEDGWVLVYSGNNLDRDLDELSEGVLEENPDALYGLRGIEDGSILVDQNGNPLQPTTDEPIEDKKPKKWMKWAAITAGAIMIGAVGAYSIMNNFGNEKPKIKINGLKLVSDDWIGNSRDIAHHKTIKLNINIESHHPLKNLKLFYATDESVNYAWVADPEPYKCDWHKYLSISIPQKPGNYPIKNVLRGSINITDNGGLYNTHVYVLNNADNITVTAVMLGDKNPFKTTFKVEAMDNQNIKTYKVLTVPGIDIPPQLISEEYNENTGKFTATFIDPDNSGYYFAAYTVDKYGNSQLLVFDKNPAIKIGVDKYKMVATFNPRIESVCVADAARVLPNGKFIEEENS